AVGALCCGFWMIRWFGVDVTVYCAAAINLLIGAVSLIWPRFIAGSEDAPSEVAAETPATDSTPRWYGIGMLLAVSGFCAMAYEVIWTKLISLMVGPTTYSFTVVLFSFITGLALGSVLF